MKTTKGLDIRTKRTAGGVCLSLEGELDLGTVGRLRAELEGAESSAPATIVLDLRGVDFMDSSGLQVILRADARARADGRRLDVVTGNSRVERVFQITQTESRLNLLRDGEASPQRRAETREPDAANPSADHTTELTVPAEPTAVMIARHAVQALVTTLDAEELEDIQLVVSELVTNSVRHANLRPNQSIRLRISASPVLVRGEVTNPGGGFQADPSAPGEGADSGWGLYLVDRLCDRWSVLTSGDATTVWFERDRERE